MPKAAALNFSTPPKPAKTETHQAPRPKHARADREDKKLVATHLPKSTHADLRILAVRLDTTQAALIEEALTDLLHKYKTHLK